MHKGVRMMLEALGIHIDPVEIESFFNKLKGDIPAAAQYIEKEFRAIETRLERIERLLGEPSTAAAPAPGALLTAAELTLWETGEIGYREMRDLLIRRFVALKKVKEVLRNGQSSSACVS